MGLTALGVANAGLAEIGIEALSSIISTTNQQQIQCRNLLYAEARYLRSLANFIRQKRTHSFDLESGRSKYPLPQDFYAPCLETHWDSDNKWRLIGPEGDSEFTAQLYGIAGDQFPVSYRPFGPDGAPSTGTSTGQFQVYPTPSSSGRTLVFEYYSSHLFLPPYWQPSETGITTSKYRFCNGLILDCTAITTGTTGTTPPTAAGTDGGVTWAVLSTAYETIIADDDQCVFDDDVMIAGFKWRYLKAKGLDYGVEAEEYKRLVSTAQTRFKGSFRGSFGRPRMGSRYRIPAGGWSF